MTTLSSILPPVNLSTASGTLPAGNGGTGLTSPGTAGNILTSDGTGWTSAAAPSSAVSFPQNSQTSAYTLVLSDQGKQISITTGGITIPANSSVPFPIGSTVCFYNNSSSNQFISITTDTLREAGTGATGTRMLAQYGFATCVKVASTTWVISGAEPFSVEYLVVAGGGGGGRYGGGGGAGGFLTGTFTPVVTGTTYTVTVGAGGAGGAGAVSGNNSVFGSFTSFGGGGAGTFGNLNGKSGGSGGGGGGGTATATGGAGTVGQGNAGGGGANYRGGGGGGAGAVGENSVGTGGLGNGGTGLSSSISGSSVFYAGGGGGRSNPPGAGGAGGGGGGSYSGTGTAGTANTGGGGGGGGTGGGAGGSGVVIIRYPDAFANASSTTGSPTLTNTGGFKIYTFNASGTITW